MKNYELIEFLMAVAAGADVELEYEGDIFTIDMPGSESCDGSITLMLEKED